MTQITTGEEGYISSGGPGSGWRNDGTKGVDFGANLQDANISFGTIHVCKRLTFSTLYKSRYLKNCLSSLLHVL